MSSSATPIPIDRLLAHREWVRRVARAMVRDENDADDLEQGMWLDALQHPPRSARSLRGWLFTALRRDRVNARRSEDCRARREEATAHAEATPPAEDLVARADAHTRVAVAVMALAEPYRSTILYRFFEDLPPSEIARRQGVPVETVRTRLKRALAQLRARLDAEYHGHRGAWSLALIPSLRRPSPGSTAGVSAVAAAMGALTMGVKSNAAAVALVVLLLGGAVGVWISNHDSEAIRDLPESAAVPEPDAAPRGRARTRAAAGVRPEEAVEQPIAAPLPQGAIVGKVVRQYDPVGGVVQGRIRTADGAALDAPVRLVFLWADETDRAGRVLFTGETEPEAPDRFSIALKAKRCWIEVHPIVGDADPETVRHGPFDVDTPEIEITLRPTTRIEGTLRPGPAFGATSGWIYFLPTDGAGDPGRQPANALFDGFGAFRSPPVAAGRSYDVIVRCGDGARDPIAWGVARGVWPGALDVEITASPPRVVRGRVFDADGRPPAQRTAVIAWPDVPGGERRLSRATYTAPDGTFEAPFLPAFRLKMMAGHAGAPVWTPEPVVVEERVVDGVALRIAPTVPFTGRILLPDGRAARAGKLRIPSQLDADVPAGTFSYPYMLPGPAHVTWESSDGDDTPISVDFGEITLPAENVVLVVPGAPK